MIRVKRQTTGSYTFTDTPMDDDGYAVAPVAPYSAKLYDGSGAQLATPTATFADGKFSAAIPVATMPHLDDYTIVWTGTLNGTAHEWTTELQLVGGYIFEIADLRASDRAFTDVNKYPTELLRAVRTAVEDVIEGPRAAQIAFVPRHTRAVIDGTGPDLTRAYNPLLYGNERRMLIAPDFAIRQVYSGAINGVTLTTEDLAGIQTSDNQLWRVSALQYPAWPYGHSNIQLHYEHGLDRAPGAIKRAALILAREYLIKSDLPGRATATSIGDQMFRLTIAGRDGLTGIPDVDAAIKNHGRAAYGLG